MQISPISCRRSANRAPPIRFSVVNCQPKRCADARVVRPYMRFIVFQSHPYCAVKWVRLHGEMGEIIVQNGCDWNERCKSLVINVADASGRLNICRDARLVRPLRNPRAFAQVIAMDFTERAAIFAFFPFYFYPLSFSLFFLFPFILFQIIVLTLQENVGSCTMICCN